MDAIYAKVKICGAPDCHNPAKYENSRCFRCIVHRVPGMSLMPTFTAVRLVKNVRKCSHKGCAYVVKNGNMCDWHAADIERRSVTTVFKLRQRLSCRQMTYPRVVLKFKQP